MEKKTIMRWIGVSVAAIVAIVLIFCCFYIVDAGHAASLKTFGKIHQQTYQSGFGVKAPWTHVTEYDLRTKKLSDKTASYTADMQTAEIEYNLTYNLKEDLIYVLDQTVGTDYESKKVIPLLNDVLKDIIGKWQAQELVANRDSARVQVTKALQEKLDKRFFENITFQFNNIDYSDNFEKAIEAKVIAEQKAQEARNNTLRIQEEAKQKVIAAEAEAKAMEIQAKALASNPALTQYEAVKKWDGKMPQNYYQGTGNSTFMVPFGK
jgi:regulator of protease activity HflC (stomatin/prohibitin superfamily)